jgi:hypothetical protein
MHVIEIPDIKLDIEHEPTFIRVPFCKRQYVLEWVKRAHARELGHLSENIVKGVLNAKRAHTDEYDFVYRRKRLEVKSSRAYNHRGNRSLCVMSGLGSDPLYDCNIQHIKKALFDILVYVIYCVDGVMIFRVREAEIDKKNLSYSDRQQRNHSGNGQFHINHSTYRRHKKYLMKTMTYQEVYDLLTEIDGFV